MASNGIAIRHGHGLKLFHPTESPADAMMVLKKVAENGSVNISTEADGTVIRSHSNDKWHAFAPTLELAICLFAREVCGK